MMKKFLAVFFARNLEFFRDKATFFWNIFFPVFMILGFAFAFSGDNTVSYKIGLIGKNYKAEGFYGYQHLQFINYDGSETALKKLAHHQIDMIIDTMTGKYYINSESANGYLAERILLSDTSLHLQKEMVTGQKIRNVDWFVPGVLGMNIVFGCLMGVGYVIIRYRKNGVLKRFKATPLHAYEFIIAQLFSRFFIVMFMSFIIYIGTNFILHFKMEGSYVDLILITSLAVLCHISLGLLFSTRIKSEEFGGGVINLLSWPMMFLSGIFFSLEGTPKVMQYASRIFPITHFIEGARKIMLDGVGLSGIMENLIVLIVATIIFLLLSAIFFKWE
jgi:ABC transporter DrrB family efflux protein